MPKVKGPSIQWYYKQWLGDQKVLGMDWDANGMHFWLINLSVQEDPAGTIPNDMALIRRWLRLSPGIAGQCQRTNDPACRCSDCIWRRVQPQIFNAWSLQNGRWYQKGVQEAVERQRAFSEGRSLAAKSRWKNKGDPLEGDAYALHMEYEKDALQSSSSYKKQKQTTTPQAAFVLPDWVPRKEWDAWIEMRKKKRAVPTAHAMEIAVKRLQVLEASGSNPRDVLNEATFRGWTGLFEVKQSVLSTGYGSPGKEKRYESRNDRILREALACVDDEAPQNHG